MHNTGGVRPTGGLENTAKSTPRARTVCRASGGVRGRLLRKATNSAYATDRQSEVSGSRAKSDPLVPWIGRGQSRILDAFGVALGRSFPQSSSPAFGHPFLRFSCSAVFSCSPLFPHSSPRRRLSTARWSRRSATKDSIARARG